MKALQSYWRISLLYLPELIQVKFLQAETQSTCKAEE